MKFNYFYFAVVSSSVHLLFRCYLEKRQYNVEMAYLETKLEPFAHLESYCSRSMTLLDHKNYPNCPNKAKNAFIGYSASRASLKCGAFTSFLEEFLELLLFASGLFKGASLALGLQKNFFLDFFVLYFFSYLPGLITNLTSNFFQIFYMIPRYTTSDFGLDFIPILIILLYAAFKSYCYSFSCSCTVFVFMNLMPIYLFVPSMLTLLIIYGLFDNNRELSEFHLETLEKSKYRSSFSPLIKSLGFPETRVLVALGEKENNPSLQGNACLMGCLGYYWMFVSDGILKTLTLAEVKGIIGHELGHWIHGHVNKRLVSMFAYGIIYYLAFQKFRNNESVASDFGILHKRDWTVASWFLWGFCTKWFEVLNSFYTTGISQCAELESDVYSTTITYGPAFKSGLTKIVGGSGPTDPIVRRIYVSHPDLPERHFAIDRTLERLRHAQGKTSKTLPRKNPSRSSGKSAPAPARRRNSKGRPVKK